MAHWLLKTEAAAYSMHDLERDGTTMWDGVRNYEARNSMQAMKVGDHAIIYHSNANPPGAAGVARIVGKARPDPTAFDRRDSHFDPKSNPEKPTWYGVDVEHVEAFENFVPLHAIRSAPKLQSMALVSGKRMRLSILPVDKRHFNAIVKMGGMR